MKCVASHFNVRLLFYLEFQITRDLFEHLNIFNNFFPDYKRHRGVVGSGGSGYPPPRSGYDELDTTLMPPRGGGEYDRGSPGPMQAGAMPQHFHGPSGDVGKSFI